MVEINPIQPASLRGVMSKPEEDELSEEQQKKNAYSVIVALIAVVIIGISFVWHLWSALFPTPSP
jgi:F0F1-type ATP synthase assembly protein I